MHIKILSSILEDQTFKKQFDTFIISYQIQDGKKHNWRHWNKRFS